MADVAPPVEPLCVTHIRSEFTDLGETAGVGIGVPANWTADSSPWVQVISDGTPRMSYPAAVHTTIRLVARAKQTTEAQRLCSLAQAVLSDHPGSDGAPGQIARVRPLTGVMPVRDTDTRAELAWATCQVTVRTQRIT